MNPARKKNHRDDWWPKVIFMIPEMPQTVTSWSIHRLLNCYWITSIQVPYCINTILRYSVSSPSRPEHPMSSWNWSAIWGTTGPAGVSPCFDHHPFGFCFSRNGHILLIFDITPGGLKKTEDLQEDIDEITPAPKRKKKAESIRRDHCSPDDDHLQHAVSHNFQARPI